MPLDSNLSCLVYTPREMLLMLTLCAVGINKPVFLALQPELARCI